VDGAGLALSKAQGRKAEGQEEDEDDANIFFNHKASFFLEQELPRFFIISKTCAKKKKSILIFSPYEWPFTTVIYWATNPFFG
jgi:hypothetical protein